ncbi:MAG: hypothetical protein AAF916_12175, partial [Planctomycetota bacterium]
MADRSSLATDSAAVVSSRATLPAKPSAAPDQPLGDPHLFEVGWEVCWQLGGIYTVLRTKALAMTRRWGDRYALVGPYNPATAHGEFEQRPAEGWLGDALEELRGDGINVLHGLWLVNGRPRTLLVDHRAVMHRLPE